MYDQKRCYMWDYDKANTLLETTREQWTPDCDEYKNDLRNRLRLVGESGLCGAAVTLGSEVKNMNAWGQAARLNQMYIESSTSHNMLT